MSQPKVRSETGSAVLEFIVFVVLGQMLAFTGALALSSTFTSKVELQILATNAAKSISMNQEPILPPDVQLSRNSCSSPLICITLRQGAMSVAAVDVR